MKRISDSAACWQAGPSGNNDKYLPLEADRLLPMFMVNDMPDEMRFTDVIGGLIREAAAGHNGHIRVFGEMVAILCGQKSNILRSGGKHEAAIRIEKCFNKLMKQNRFSLLCGYPMGAFPRASDAKLFHEVCSLHSSVIPTEKHNASASIFATGSVHAANFSFTGNFSSEDEVQPFNFSVEGAATDVTVRTWSYDGGTNAAGTVIPSGGFDPIITLFNATTGALIDANDDYFNLDSTVTGNLATGNCTATLTQYDKFVVGPLLENGFRTSHYSLSGLHWAVDILNVNSASAGVPYISAVTPVPGIRSPKPTQCYWLALAF